MKTYILIFSALLLFIFSGKAQKSFIVEVNPDTVIHVSVDHFPEFPGGIKNFNRFVAETIRYPSSAVEHYKYRRVFLSMIVERNGTLSDIKVDHGLSPELDKEALRVMSLSPKWKPGTLNGRAVRLYYDVQIIFERRDK